MLLCGGQAVQPHLRFDVLLEKKRQKFQLKYRKVFIMDASSAGGINMSMYYPCTVRDGKTVYFYSVAQLKEEWMLRIEVAGAVLDAVSVKQSSIRFYAIDYRSLKAGRIATVLSRPFFSKIMRYDEFSSDYLTTWLEKLRLWLKSAIQHEENAMHE